MESQENTQRTRYFDYLRVIATIAVIILHVASQNWSFVAVTSHEWRVFNFYNSIVRWGVPVFVMISGSLFLSRPQKIQKIYQKNILRIITAFIFWSCLYAFPGFRSGLGIKETLGEVINGHYHMWFLYMIVGLYVLVPFLEKIVQNETLIKYFLLLALIFSVIIPQIVKVIYYFSGPLSGVIANTVGRLDYHFTAGYVGYFVLGYYLNRIEIAKKYRYVIYILGLVGFSSTIVLTWVCSIMGGVATDAFFDNFKINILLESISVFLFIKNILNYKKTNGLDKVMKRLSKYSFGAYLVHAMVIELFYHRLHLTTLSYEPIIMIPFIGIIVFVISFSVSAILNHIPILKRYIV